MLLRVGYRSYVHDLISKVRQALDPTTAARLRKEPHRNWLSSIRRLFDE